MTKEELKKIAGKYLIFEDEMIDAIRFVSDLLKFEADEIRKRAPYATFNIKHLEQTKRWRTINNVYYLV